MTILDSTYACNRCGKEMKHRDAKLVMGEWTGDSFEKLDIHICSECRPELIAFANRQRIGPISLLAKTAGVGEPIIQKKHEFYGNQYILPNRKSRK